MGGVGGAKRPPSLKSVTHTHNDETWHSYTLPKEDQKKYMNHVTHPLSSAHFSIFHRKSANFAISRNRDINCILVHNFCLF